MNLGARTLGVPLCCLRRRLIGFRATVFVSRDYVVGWPRLASAVQCEGGRKYFVHQAGTAWGVVAGSPKCSAQVSSSARLVHLGTDPQVHGGDVGVKELDDCVLALPRDLHLVQLGRCSGRFLRGMGVAFLCCFTVGAHTRRWRRPGPGK